MTRQDLMLQKKKNPGQYRAPRSLPAAQGSRSSSYMGFKKVVQLRILALTWTCWLRSLVVCWFSAPPCIEWACESVYVVTLTWLMSWFDLCSCDKLFWPKATVEERICFSLQFPGQSPSLKEVKAGTCKQLPLLVYTLSHLSSLHSHWHTAGTLEDASHWVTACLYFLTQLLCNIILREATTSIYSLKIKNGQQIKEGHCQNLT